MKIKKMIFVTALALFCVTSLNAQSWRNCVPGSIGPGGCDSIGPGGGRSIGPGGGYQLDLVVVCLSATTEVSLLALAEGSQLVQMGGNLYFVIGVEV
jgi:hypothetical protein